VNAGHKPTVYATSSATRHIGRLALQYWMFYVADWNNLHEGDRR
jgi:hypothetical protein